MSSNETSDGPVWVPAWTQAMTDFRLEDDEAPFDNVTVRMTVPAAIGGNTVRLEVSNRFGEDAVLIGHAAAGVASTFGDLSFDGQKAVDIPAGESRWSDPIEHTVEHGDDILVDLFLPHLTPYASANGFRFDRSTPGDYVGATSFPLEGTPPEEIDPTREFPAANTGTEDEQDGSGWSLPAGGPFLRTVEVQRPTPSAVVVCLGSSSMAMGWPQYAAGILPADTRIAIVNRGIAGNRILRDAPEATPSWGRAGLARFDEDVLGTAGATHVVVAYNSNDFGLPGRVTSIDEMPTVEDLTGGYQLLAHRAQAAGLSVIFGTINPLSPELAADADREAFRLSVNEWIRTSGYDVVDLDNAVRSDSDPSRIDDAYAAPDHTHPSIDGEKRLASALVDVLVQSEL